MSMVAAARARAWLQPGEWRRLAAMAAVIVALHLLGFAVLFAAVAGHYRLGATGTFGLGTGLLAYSLGLRHAFDADHITAIDNTTRKLMGDGQRPLGVGFYFSLGHATVVFVLAVLLNVGIRALGAQVRDGRSALHHYTGLIGTSVSGTVLLLLGALNLVVLVSIGRVFARLRQGRFDEAELEQQLSKRGLWNRLLGPLTRSIDASWKAYPLGVAFGLGFDTASEVALLVLAGTGVAAGLPFWAILSLPVLFAAGMSLLDTIDGSFMNFAYGWALSQPVRKIYYNLVITGLSVAVAVFLGGVELAQVVSGQLRLSGGFWQFAAGFDLNRAGLVIVAMFVVVWGIAVAVWHLARVEARFGTGLAGADAE